MKMKSSFSRVGRHLSQMPSNLCQEFLGTSSHRTKSFQSLFIYLFVSGSDDGLIRLMLLSACQSEGSGFSTPSSLFRPSSSLHKLSTSERRRGRPPGALSISRSSKMLKAKPKKKKKRWNVEGSDSDSDDCTGDPDWS